MSQVTPNTPYSTSANSFQELYNQATLELNAGNYQAIVNGLGQQLIEDYPEEPTGFSLYAAALEMASRKAIELSNWSVAENYSARAYALSPNYKTAMAWAEVAWLNGNNATALTAYQKASQTEQGRSEAWPHINMAKIYSFSGQKNKQLSSLETALAVLNTSVQGKAGSAYIDVLMKLAACYTTAQDFDKAKASYQAVLEQQPTHQLANQALQALSTPNN